MGIHYDYKSTRGDKAMKKEAKRKARIEQRRAKRSSTNPKNSEHETMHDINTVSYTHLRSPRDVEESRMPSSA